MEKQKKSPIWPEEVRKTLKKLPKSPGVYKFFNEEDELLYIGKAKFLINRVKNYFQAAVKHSPKTKKMVTKIQRIEWEEVSSETEALILEKNLVHELQPPYNILLRDDKNFLYLKISKESFPIVSFTRTKNHKEGAMYFGPYTSAKKIRSLIDFLREILAFRTCRVGISEKGSVVSNPERRNIPCLDFQIKRCTGPCNNHISSEKYHKDIEELVSFLKGKSANMKHRVREEMMIAAGKKEFERAARFRDILATIEAMNQTQVASVPIDFSADVIGASFGKEKTFFQVIIVREGKILRSENFILQNAENERETLFVFLRDHASLISENPGLFLVSHIFPEDQKNLWEEYFFTITGKATKIRIPERGVGRQLMDLAEKNANIKAVNSRASFEHIDVLECLEKSLDLPKRPERIECYDISHLSGSFTVGSRVVFTNGKSNKAEYRHYKIKDLPEGKIDDFSAMAELLGRRIKRLERGISIFNIKQVRKKEEKQKIEKLLEDNGLITGIPYEKQYVFSENISGEEVGYARLRYRGKFAEIGGVFTMPEVRNAGIGTEIIKTLVLSLKEKWVRVLIRKTNLKWMLSLKTIGFEEEKKPPKVFQEAINKRIEEENIEMICMKISPAELKKATKKIPDLLVIDGGKGQLSAVVKVLRKMNLFRKIPVCSLAKREEEIFVPGKETPLPISKDAPENQLLQQIRDEAHRFAVSFNRKLRTKAATESSLDKISGIGEKTKRELLLHFGSPEKIFTAPEKELLQFVSKRIAEKIKNG